MTQHITQARIHALLSAQIQRGETRLAELVSAIKSALSEGDLSENSGLEQLRSEADSLRVDLELQRERLGTLDVSARLAGQVGATFTLRHEPDG